MQIIDTFPAFLYYWSQAQANSPDDLIEGWAKEYLSAWPELLAKQIEDYTAQNVDWHEIAHERIFPHLPERLPAMQEAHRILLEWCSPIYSRAKSIFGLDFDVQFIIYVGIGCGAGWATQYAASPAILFGLENIDECGWSNPTAIKNLVAHELGHLEHDHWRSQAGKSSGSGAWWQLYTEGFAKHCEQLIVGSDSMQSINGHQGNEWLTWCEDHKGWLASEYLRMAKAGDSVSPFFGSWYEIGGKSECGYFLGEKVLKELEKQFTLKDIALLEPIDQYLKPILEAFAR